VTVYGLVLSRLGRKALAVTTNCSLDFMRKPEAGVDLIARGTLLKLGRSLAVGDVHMFSDGSDKMVARSTMTYSIPPEK
jgi:acyl-coenzyme A thioesterase PaaI-like protein